MFRLLDLIILTLSRADIVRSRRHKVQHGWLLRLPQWCLLAAYLKKWIQYLTIIILNISAATVALMHFYFLYPTYLWLWRLICSDGFRGSINSASPLEDCFPQSQGLNAFMDRTSLHKEIYKHMQQNTLKGKISQYRAPYWPWQSLVPFSYFCNGFVTFYVGTVCIFEWWQG